MQKEIDDRMEGQNFSVIHKQKSHQHLGAEYFEHDRGAAGNDNKP